MIKYRRLENKTWEIENDDGSWVSIESFNKFCSYISPSSLVLAWNNINMVPHSDVTSMVEMHESGCEHLLEGGRQAYDFMGWNELYPTYIKALDGLYDYSQELLRSSDCDDIQFENGVMAGYLHIAPCTEHARPTEEEIEESFNILYNAWLAQHPELEDDRNMTDAEYDAYLARNPVYARYKELSEKIDKMLDEDDYAELSSGEKEEFEELSAIYQYKIDERFG
jgi:hypothetical protein